MTLHSLKMRATEDIRSDTLVQFVKDAWDDDVTIVNGVRRIHTRNKPKHTRR